MEVTALAALLTYFLVAVPGPGQTVRAVEVVLVVNRHFPVEARATMMCIGFWETRQDPYSNKLVGAAGEVSWLQIHPIHLDRWPRAWLRESVDNAAQAGRQIYEDSLARGKSGFAPWATYWSFCR